LEIVNQLCGVTLTKEIKKKNKNCKLLQNTKTTKRIH